MNEKQGSGGIHLEDERVLDVYSIVNYQIAMCLVVMPISLPVNEMALSPPV